MTQLATETSTSHYLFPATSVLTRPEPKMPFWSSQLRPTQVALALREKDIRSTHFKSSRRKYYFFVSSNQFIDSYKYPQFMLRLKLKQPTCIIVFLRQ